MFHKNPQFKISILLILITLAVFWQLPSHEFVNIDDSVYVTKNPHVQEGLTANSVTWAFTSFHAEFWHPITWLSYMLDYELYGMNPGGYLFTNLIIHIASTILLFVFLVNATGALWRSAIIAVLFAVHPLHVESVAWIAERKDLLSTFFWMLTMLFYSRYAIAPDWKGYLVFSLFFLLGLMSKPMLVTLPCVLLLMDYWPLKRFGFFTQNASEKHLNRSNIKKVIFEKIPLLIISILFGLIAILAQKSGHGLASSEIFPLKARIANALIAYIGYLRKTFYPYDLAVFYPYVFQFHLWQILFSSLLLIVISLAAIYFIKESPYVITGWLWFIGTLVPVIGIVKFGGAFAMADRYTYVPLIGIFMAIVWGGYDLLLRFGIRKILISVISIACTLILMITSWIQVGYWKNSVTLFEHALRVTTNNFLAHKNLGRAYINRGRIDLALPHFQRALKIEPDNPTAHLNIGTCYLFYGEFEKAETFFKKALELNPAYPKARVNLDKAIHAQKNIDLAISIVQTTARLNPNDPVPQYHLGEIYLQKGNLDKALYHYEKALTLKPDAEDARRAVKSLRIKKSHSNGG